MLRGGPLEEASLLARRQRRVDLPVGAGAEGVPAAAGHAEVDHALLARRGRPGVASEGRAKRDGDAARRRKSAKNDNGNGK